MRPLKEKICITIDSDLLQELKVEAERDERSLSQFINLILRKKIQKKRQKNHCFDKDKNDNIKYFIRNLLCIYLLPFFYSFFFSFSAPVTAAERESLKKYVPCPLKKNAEH